MQVWGTKASTANTNSSSGLVTVTYESRTPLPKKKSLKRIFGELLALAHIQHRGANNKYGFNSRRKITKGLLASIRGTRT